MSRISYLAVATACFFFGTSHGFPSARAIPVQQLAASGIVTVSSGCGLGVRRGPFDRCDPFYYAGYGSSYRNAYYIGPVSGGVCAGRGAHIACNRYGICWVACN
jgi:hypothetical protein